MIWQKLFGRKPDPALALYENLVQKARNERFYREWGVPDTVDGRFDMIVLHLFLVFDRFKKEGQTFAGLQQSLTDTFFMDMDRSLREMGVGDLSVGKKVRKMAEACYGRLKAYDVGMQDGAAGLQNALRRNIWPDTDSGDAKSLAQWSMTAKEKLNQQSAEKIAAGEFDLS